MTSGISCNRRKLACLYSPIDGVVPDLRRSVFLAQSDIRKRFVSNGSLSREEVDEIRFFVIEH